MSFIDTFEPLYSVTGFFVGLLVGVTGVGGASLMTPLLVLFFGVHPVMAVGTDLLYAAITKTAGAAVHHRHGQIHWRMVGLLAAGSIPAAAVTLFLMSGVDRHSVQAVSLLTGALGWMLLLTALVLLLGRRISTFSLAGRPGSAKSLSAKPMSATRIAALTVLLGLFLGVVVTMTSVGAGAIGVTVLLLLYRMIPIQGIVGSDIAHAIPLTLVGGIGYWMIGEINWILLVSLLIGSVPGIILGSSIAPRMPELIVRRVLAATLILVGAKMILG
ncbi:sulfite exporter TauE/SafE family protein [Rhizobium halophytocola]|uniref:Probable membrane transporter protein n=1 Tax=Rhizobium halophytocola TaxID=735519 RepID=A0ABS4DWT7_9HYPH|nr:sulfite exporter TauE/SafE family protein [Rhizobium halophytocola]MBP1850130.1 putative membrane protein YfcA [Rhizobium halophytocola]